MEDRMQELRSTIIGQQQVGLITPPCDDDAVTIAVRWRAHGRPHLPTTPHAYHGNHQSAAHARCGGSCSLRPAAEQQRRHLQPNHHKTNFEFKVASELTK
jgi:hypothetical protein